MAESDDARAAGWRRGRGSTLTRARTRTGRGGGTRARRRGFRGGGGVRGGAPGRATAATRAPGAAARTWRWGQTARGDARGGTRGARAATRVRRARGRRGPRGARTRPRAKNGARNARGARARVSDAAGVAGDACIVDRLALGARGRCASGISAPDEDSSSRRIGSRDLGRDVLPRGADGRRIFYCPFVDDDGLTPARRDLTTAWPSRHERRRGRPDRGGARRSQYHARRHGPERRCVPAAPAGALVTPAPVAARRAMATPHRLVRPDAVHAVVPLDRLRRLTARTVPVPRPARPRRRYPPPPRPRSARSWRRRA